MLTNITSVLLLLVGLLLIFVILLQRGRGGGLAGAFGGAGGQSAFGTKAGDVFTRITIGIAIVWVTMAVLTGYAMTYDSGKTRYGGGTNAKSDAAGADGAVEPVEGAPAKPNPFEAGSQEGKTAPSKEASKATTPSTTTPQKSSPGASDKGAASSKTAPTKPPAPSK
jgi:preprotein translocase subunit SecG